MKYRIWIRNGLLRGVNSVERLLPRRAGKRIIAFHEIADRQKFREKMEWLRHEVEIVHLDQLFSQPTGSKTQVAITFDDGYASWHENVLPVLTDLKIPAVFFVCSGFVGLQNQEAADFLSHHLRRQQKLCPLSKSQLLALANQPLFEIGSHTVHHIDLGREWEKKVLMAEIADDRQSVEDWIGQPVRWFAYPFGAPKNISLKARDFVRQAGFSAALTLVPGFWQPENDRFRVGRDGLDVNDPDWLWRAWLDGSYDNLYTLKAKLLHMTTNRSKRKESLNVA